LIVGPDDVLLNNIAWALRRLPLFPIAGDGGYRVQPVTATDVARIAFESGREARGRTFDVAGPEAIAFKSLVRAIRGAVGAHARIVHVPTPVARALARAAGRLLRDVVVTREELDALTSEQLVSVEPPLGTTRFDEWLLGEADTLGESFVSDRRRHWKEEPPP
jgi:NADH dehydrogenase